MEIINKEIGPETKLRVDIVEGKLVFSGLVDTSGLGVNLSATIETDYFLDQLAKAIPGTVDDAIIAVIKAALKSLK